MEVHHFRIHQVFCNLHQIRFCFILFKLENNFCMMEKIEFDSVTKLIVIILAVVIAYVISLAVIISISSPSTTEGMTGMMGSLSNPYSNILPSAISLIPALVVGFVVALSIKTKDKSTREVNEYKVLKKALSADEAVV